MSIVYRKTEKGVTEIATRALRLGPRQRSALILVDGRKTDAELAQLILADPASTLTNLLAEGFIEVLATLADRPAEHLAERPAERKAAAPVVAAARPAGSDGAAFESLRRDAARALNDQLGPAAELIAVKIERARSMPELQPLLVQAAKLLRNVRGSAAAEAFSAHFIATPEA